MGWRWTKILNPQSIYGGLSPSNFCVSTFLNGPFPINFKTYNYTTYGTPGLDV